MSHPVNLTFIEAKFTDKTKILSLLWFISTMTEAMYSQKNFHI